MIVQRLKNWIRAIVKLTRSLTRSDNNTFINELIVWKKGLYPPGHFHSPIVDVASISTGDSVIDYNASIPGIDLNSSSQLTFLEQLAILYDPKAFPETEQPSHRYFFRNDYFSYSDGIFLNLILRHIKPKTIIEIGSGFSSALLLDTNEYYFENQLNLIFIEPNIDRLTKLVRAKDRYVLKKDLVQNIELSLFDQLKSGDLLFIDSSHVSKYDSDVNYILFNILPRLASGVIIHFHDVFFPFEYPKEWLLQGRSWNEGYLVRAFLQYNQEFEILLFTSYLEGRFREWFELNMPVCLTPHENIQLGGVSQLMSTTGQSLYLRKK